MSTSSYQTRTDSTSKSDDSSPKKKSILDPNAMMHGSNKSDQMRGPQTQMKSNHSTIAQAKDENGMQKKDGEDSIHPHAQGFVDSVDAGSTYTTAVYTKIGEKYSGDKYDTLFSIAKRLGISLDEIYSLNPTIIAEELVQGQKIVIPTSNKEEASTYLSQDYNSLSSTSALNDATSYNRTINDGTLPLLPGKNGPFISAIRKFDDKLDFSNEIASGEKKSDTVKAGITYTKNGGGASSATTRITEKWLGQDSLDEFLAIRPDAGKFNFPGKLSSEQGRNIATGVNRAADAGMEVSESINKNKENQNALSDQNDTLSNTKKTVPSKGFIAEGNKTSIKENKTKLEDNQISLEENKLSYEEERRIALERYGLRELHILTLSDGEEQLFLLDSLEGSTMPISLSELKVNHSEIIKYATYR